MKLSVFLRHVSPVLLVISALASVIFLTSCGSTIYGMGVDMERIGNRMQGSGRPPAGSGNQAPSQSYQAPAANDGWSYYQQ